MIKIVFFVFLTCFLLNVNATNYYVSNSGSDNNSGLSPETPWKTIEKINNSEFEPGDKILFKCNNTWRVEELRMPSSGAKSNPILLGYYGNGVKPELLGSVEVKTWTHTSGNIWVSKRSITHDPWNIGYDGPEIFFEKGENVLWGIHRNSIEELNAELNWTWNDEKVYIYSENDPNTIFTAVEVPQNSKIIMLMDQNYITIDGLAIKYCGDAAIYDQYATIELFGLTVTNCEIAYVGKKNGGAAYGMSVHHSDSYFANNEIHNCGRRGLSLVIYKTDPIRLANIVIENNYFHHGWHTTSLDCSTTGSHTIENVFFRNNLVEGDPNIMLDGVNPNSNHVFLDNQSSGGGNVRNFWFINNIFTWAHGSSIKYGDVENVYIYNNTFYNFNPTLANWQAHVFSHYSKKVDIQNNIFCNNANTNYWAAIECNVSVVNNINVNYNLYYNDDPGRRMFWVDGGKSYDVEEWDTYRSTTGKDTNSPTPANPLFVNVQSGDFSLQANSPAIGAGINLEDVNDDFFGTARINPPDLGAIQYRVVNTNDKAIIKTFKVHFNKSSQSLKIISSTQKDNERIQVLIYDIQGRNIFSLVDFTGNMIKLPNLLNEGIYLVKINDNKGQTAIEKFFVRS